MFLHPAYILFEGYVGLPGKRLNTGLPWLDSVLCGLREGGQDGGRDTGRERAKEGGREGEINNIGVNHPAIVREIPHFGLFPAFPHFARTSRIFCFISKYQKSLKIAIIFTVRRHFVGKSSAKTAMIASPSYLT